MYYKLQSFYTVLRSLCRKLQICTKLNVPAMGMVIFSLLMKTTTVQGCQFSAFVCRRWLAKLVCRSEGSKRSCCLLVGHRGLSNGSKPAWIGLSSVQSVYVSDLQQTRLDEYLFIFLQVTYQIHIYCKLIHDFFFFTHYTVCLFLFQAKANTEQQKIWGGLDSLHTCSQHSITLLNKSGWYVLLLICLVFIMCNGIPPWLCVTHLLI